MGKKKKFKNSLFSKDYSDISLEEQMKMTLLADQIMAGNYDEYDSTDDELEKVQEEVKFENNGNWIEDMFKAAVKSTISEPVVEEQEEIVVKGPILFAEVTEEEDELTHEDYAEMLESTFVATPVKVKAVEVIEEKPVEIEEDDEPEEDFSIESDDEDEEDDEPFKLFMIDPDTCELIIKDPWKEYKSHCINILNVPKARTDYENSVLYNSMKEYCAFALAFIAGPTLVIESGNKLFQEFINTVKNYNTSQIYVMSYTKVDGQKDANGDPITRFLLYYIDNNSLDEIEMMLETFEKKDSILGFFTALYKKTVDIYENPWAVYDNYDFLFDEYASSDEDIKYVLDLIRQDEDTKIGTSNYDIFMSKFVIPIEVFITSANELPNVFNTISRVLTTFMVPESSDKIVDDDFVIDIPADFVKVGEIQGHIEESDDEEEYETEDEFSMKNEDEEEYEEDNSEDDDEPEELEIDDVDDSDEVELTSGYSDTKYSDKSEPINNMMAEALAKSGFIPKEEPKSLFIQQATQKNGIKKLGKTPYNGGPMIVK